MFSFPPLERRVVSWSVGKHKRSVFIEQVNILPVGGGLWVPVRNMTKNLRALESRLAAAKKQFEELKAAAEAERKFVEEEINRIGYYTEAYVIKDSETGEYREFDARSFVTLSLGITGPTLNKKDSSIRKVVHTPLLNASRPKQNKPEDQQKKKG